MLVSRLSQMYQKIWISRKYRGHMFFSFLFLIASLQTQHRLKDFLMLLDHAGKGATHIVLLQVLLFFHSCWSQLKPVNTHDYLLLSVSFFFLSSVKGVCNSCYATTGTLHPTDGYKRVVPDLWTGGKVQEPFSPSWHWRCHWGWPWAKLPEKKEQPSCTHLSCRDFVNVMCGTGQI